MKAKLSFLAALCCTLFSFAQPAPEVQDAALDCFLQYQHGLKDAAPHRIQAGVRYQIGH